jgi:hypothetical protein
VRLCPGTGCRFESGSPDFCVEQIRAGARMRRDSPVEEGRLLFSSAHDSTGKDELSRQSNERFLRKPYRLQELVQTLRKMTATSDAEPEQHSG